MELNTTRRGFLFGLGAAMAASAVPVGAWGGVDHSAYSTKINKLAELYDHAVVVGKEVYAKYSFNPHMSRRSQLSAEDVKQITHAMHDVFEFMMNNFKYEPNGPLNKDSAEFRQVHLMFNGVETEEEIKSVPRAERMARLNSACARWRDVPPTLLEVVIPVAVARGLLSENQLMLDPTLKSVDNDGNEYSPFDMFAKGWQDMILAA